MTCNTVGPLGDLTQYLDAIKNISFLTLEEERKCGETKDQASLDRLVTSHLVLAESLARKFCMQFKSVDYADAIQESNLELVICAQKFDPSEGVRFSTFAISRIKYALYNLQDRSNIVRVATTKDRRKLYYNLPKIKGEFVHRTGKNSLTTMEIKKISKSLDVSEEDVRDIEKFISSSDVSLDASIGGNSEGEGKLLELFGPVDHNSPEEIFYNAQRHYISTVGIQDALENLDDRGATIIRNRYLVEEHEMLTLHDLAAMFGISAERVRQLELKAIKEIREFIKLYEGTKPLLAAKELERIKLENKKFEKQQKEIKKEMKRNEQEFRKNALKLTKAFTSFDVAVAKVAAKKIKVKNRQKEIA